MLGQSRRERDALVAAGLAASLIVYVLLPRPEKLGEIPAACLLIVFMLPATASITAMLFGRLWWRDPVRDRNDALDSVSRPERSVSPRSSFSTGRFAVSELDRILQDLRIAARSLLWSPSRVPSPSSRSPSASARRRRR